MNRTCPICATTFASRYSSKKYCSPACQRRGRYEFAPRVPCVDCGARTGWKVSQAEKAAKGGPRCRACRGYGRRLFESEARCEYCGSEFVSVPRGGDGRPTRFCSKSCSDECQRGDAGRHPERECAHCGATYSRPARHLGKYCSTRCASDAPKPSRRRTWPACKVSTGTCEHCGEAWSGRYSRSYCSESCSSASRRRRDLDALRKDCGVCGQPVPGERVLSYCPGDCYDEALRRGRKAYKQRRRAAKRGTGGKIENVVAHDIFERDNWSCGICDRAIDPAATYPSRASASLDHVVPLSWGGTHTALNVQAAHLGCNMAKGARVPFEQPFLLV